MEVDGQMVYWASYADLAEIRLNLEGLRLFVNF